MNITCYLYSHFKLYKAEYHYANRGGCQILEKKSERALGTTKKTMAESLIMLTM